jgi:2-dehydro-3-deoxyphosphogluconate aldolase/(4S)-4-hydroxy-2-oxoglutarate aldolase
VAAKVEGFLLGAGTVLSIEQAVHAINAGADFIVCPGLNEEVVQFCLDHNVPVFPGTITPTEVHTCGMRPCGCARPSD